MSLVLISLITLGVIGSVAAVILFVVAKKFHVFEDPRIDEVEQALPAANCGGCGFPGCRGLPTLVLNRMSWAICFVRLVETIP